MAVFVPITDGAQAELGFRLGGEVVTNRLWFIKDNPPIVLSDLDGLVAGLISWHTTFILPSLSADITFRGARATRWTTSLGDISSETLVSIPGGDAGSSHSANVAVIVPFRWPLSHGREKKNKHYIGGVPTSQVTLNTVSDAFTDVLFEAYAALVDECRLFSPIFNWRWMVASAFDEGSPRSTQLVGECTGPSFTKPYLLGQRRKRLPVV